MKRLLNILLMNAWGGLRQKASLPTMSMVAIGLAVLLGAGTVSASASPDTSLPVVGTVAHIVKSALSTPLGSILSSPPPQKPATPPKPNTSASDPNKQQAGSNTTTSGSNTSASGSNTANTSSNSNANTQNGAQSPAATLKLASLQCNAGQSSYTIDVSNALLSFQTPTTVNGTLSWEWDTRVDSGASAGQVTAGTISSQPINANTSSVTLTGSSTSQQSQWLYTATSNNTNDYSFRLHVTGPVDVTSDWVNVPQSPTGTCPPQKQ